MKTLVAPLEHGHGTKLPGCNAVAVREELLQGRTVVPRFSWRWYFDTSTRL